MYSVMFTNPTNLLRKSMRVSFLECRLLKTNDSMRILIFCVGKKYTCIMSINFLKILKMVLKRIFFLFFLNKNPTLLRLFS